MKHAVEWGGCVTTNVNTHRLHYSLVMINAARKDKKIAGWGMACLSRPSPPNVEKSKAT